MSDLFPGLDRTPHGFQRRLHGLRPAMPRSGNPHPLIGRMVIRGEVNPAHGIAVTQDLSVISTAQPANRNRSMRPHGRETDGIEQKDQAHG